MKGSHGDARRWRHFRSVRPTDNVARSIIPRRSPLFAPHPTTGFLSPHLFHLFHLPSHKEPINSLQKNIPKKKLLERIPTPHFSAFEASPNSPYSPHHLISNA